MNSGVSSANTCSKACVKGQKNVTNCLVIRHDVTKLQVCTLSDDSNRHNKVSYDRGCIANICVSMHFMTSQCLL